MNSPRTRPFTGRHMTAILFGFFAVVIAVNFLMARLAIGTFGGVVVENSYVASQHFNRWLDEASTEQQLGWSAETARQPDGRILVTLAGLPAGTAILTAVARHPLGRLPDQALAFTPSSAGLFLSTTPLPAGRWRLRVQVQSNGQQWRHEEDVL